DPNTKTASITLETVFVDYVEEGDLRVVLYVIEDSVTGFGSGYNQQNAYNNQVGHPYYGKGNPIFGFVHRHVLRDVYSKNDVWGAELTWPVTLNSPTLTSYNIPISSAWNSKQIKFVAYVAYHTPENLAKR